MTDARIIPFPQTDTDDIDPGAELWLSLINSARPGTSRSQAYLIGLRFRSELTVTGVTEKEWRTWESHVAGRALFVHRGDGTIGTHLAWNEDAEQYVEDNPDALLTAYWGVA